VRAWYGNVQPGDPAGFFAGIWHGWIAPFALIAHLFHGDVRIYEVDNTGSWYDVASTSRVSLVSEASA
jgi:hypothetical protein